MDKSIGDVVPTDNGPATIKQIDDSLAYSDEVMYFVEYATPFGAGWIRAGEIARNGG